MRVKAFAAFCLTLLFAALCAVPGDPARAQRTRRPAPQAVAPQQPDRPKQVIIGRGADNQRGSRMTITSDEALNDYSAYRSGDRFYVELPNANAATAARAAGRGFTDLQVQRRGKNVVLSYRVQPGAKPRVEQRFNRLEVIFEVPPGEAAQAAPQTQPPPAAANTGQSTPARVETAAQSPAGQTPPAATRTPPPQTDAAQTPLTSPSTAAVVEQQPTSSQLPAEPSPSPVEQASPVSTQTAPQELAQAQPPAPVAPATTNTANAQTGSGTSLGAFLLRNWVVVLVAVLLLAGVGLLVASRRTATAAPPPPAALKESPAVKLDEARPSTTAAPVVGAAVAAPVAAAAAALKESKKESKKSKKARKAREAREELKMPAAAPVPETAAEPAPEPPTPEATPEVGAPALEESAFAETAVAETAVEEVTAEETVTTETVTTETVVDEIAVAAPVAVEPEVEETVAEPEVEETVEVAPAGEKGIVAAVVPVPTPEPEPSGSIEPAAALDPDRAHAETRLLLEGAAYDRTILSTRDAMARQMIASELLSALAGRNAERRERARAAFNEFGYFEEKADDLRTAEAAAERSSAARALGLAGDLAATPHLVAALEDDSVEVRRAAVESLATLRDPAAVGALEALLRREKKSRAKVNRKLVEHAIETCREGVAEAPAAPEVAAPAVAEVAEVEPAAEVETEAAPAVEAVEESRALEAVEEVTVERPAPEVPDATLTDATLVSEERGLEAVQTDESGLFAFAPPAAEALEPSAQFDEPPAVAEESAVVEETAAVESSAPVEEPGAVEETAAAEAPTFEAGVSVPPPASEVGRAEIETAEASSGAAWEQPAASPDVSSSSPPAAEPSALFEEEVAAAPASRASTVEEPSAFSFEGAAAAEESVGTGREERADEWVELDMSGLGTTPSAEPAGPETPVFETSGGEVVTTAPAELLTGEPAAHAPETTALDVGSIEPAPVAAESPTSTSLESTAAESFVTVAAPPARVGEEKGVAPFDEHSSVPANLQQRLASREPAERAAAVAELARVDTGESFQQICAAFDDESRDVRSAAARALYDVQGDRADSFTRALRESGAERRRNIGSAIASSGLASDAIGQLTGESREKTYEAFSLLFLMAKAGEVAPLVRAIEGHPNNEVRLAVVKLLALSGQKEILPAFRRLAVRGSLPTEVRSAVMEAIYQISSQSETTPAA